MKRIHLISGPRNLSTALMYSFGNRMDCNVVDEPFYAHYLVKNNIDHPGKQETIDSMSSDLAQILQNVIFAYYPCDYFFIKDMAHHFKDVSYDLLPLFENVFLIRDLKKLILSFSKVIPNPSLLDIGIKLEFEQFKYLEESGCQAPIINSDYLLQDPKSYMKQLCQKINIPFDKRMMSWPEGPKKEDGVWAKYWYHSVHQSTGFKKMSYQDVKLPEHLNSLYEEALPYYNYLNEKSIKL